MKNKKVFLLRLDLLCKFLFVVLLLVFLRPNIVIADTSDTQIGLDTNGISNGWPSLPAQVGVMRLWDSGVSWRKIQPDCVTLDTSTLTRFLDLAKKNGVKVSYTIGQPPTNCALDNNGNLSITATNNFLAALGKYSSLRKARGQPGIDYYELMNEPTTEEAVWKGFSSPSSLALFMQASYKTIKANDPTALIISPSASYSGHIGWSSGRPWDITDEYLAAATMLHDQDFPFYDIQAYHYYLAKDKYSISTKPDELLKVIDSMRQVMDKYGIGNKPLINTEFSWGNHSPDSEEDLAYQSNFLAQSYVLSLSKNVGLWWYGWGFTGGWGSLYDFNTHAVRLPGIVYENITSWLYGSTISSLKTSDGIYQASINLKNGQQGLIVWNENETSDFSIPIQFQNDTYKTIFGDSGQSTNRISISKSPILLLQSGTTPPSYASTSGIISPKFSNCEIAIGGSGCSVNLTWATVNPIGISSITSPGMVSVQGNYGSQNFPVQYPGRKFYLYNNSAWLATSTAAATCEFGKWDGYKCTTNRTPIPVKPVGPEPGPTPGPIRFIIPNPTHINKNPVKVSRFLEPIIYLFSKTNSLQTVTLGAITGMPSYIFWAM